MEIEVWHVQGFVRPVQFQSLPCCLTCSIAVVCNFSVVSLYSPPLLGNEKSDRSYSTSNILVNTSHMRCQMRSHLLSWATKKAIALFRVDRYNKSDRLQALLFQRGFSPRAITGLQHKTMKQAFLLHSG
jgi:hypothetical protein